MATVSVFDSGYLKERFETLCNCTRDMAGKADSYLNDPIDILTDEQIEFFKRIDRQCKIMKAAQEKLSEQMEEI